MRLLSDAEVQSKLLQAEVFLGHRAVTLHADAALKVARESLLKLHAAILVAGNRTEKSMADG